jgi:hypothetical protein
MEPTPTTRKRLWSSLLLLDPCRQATRRGTYFLALDQIPKDKICYFLSSAVSTLMCLCFMPGATRETIEGWPFLTVETEVNGDSRVRMKGSFLGWFVGLVVPVLSNGNLFTKTIIHNKAQTHFFIFLGLRNISHPFNILSGNYINDSFMAHFCSALAALISQYKIYYKYYAYKKSTLLCHDPFPYDVLLKYL